MNLIIQKNPPIDLGIALVNNCQQLRISLIFFDFSVDWNSKRKRFEYLLGFGIPLYKAIIFTNCEQ